jgi:hypothetical protein
MGGKLTIGFGIVDTRIEKNHLNKSSSCFISFLAGLLFNYKEAFKCSVSLSQPLRFS